MSSKSAQIVASRSFRSIKELSERQELLELPEPLEQPEPLAQPEQPEPPAPPDRQDLLQPLGIIVRKLQ